MDLDVQVLSTNSPARIPFPLLRHFPGFSEDGYDEGTGLRDPGEEGTVLWGNTRGCQDGIHALWDPDRVHTSNSELQSIGLDAIHWQSTL